jgi:maleate isomerase
VTATFEPDGWDVRLRVGLLVPDGDIGPESEWSAIAPTGLRVHASRFRFPVDPVNSPGDQIGMGPVEFVAAEGPLDEAISLFTSRAIDVFSLAFTSTSYVGDDNDLVARLSAKVGGKPVVTTGQALLAAVAHFGASKILLVDPPWFPSGLTGLGRDWLERNGVGVTRAEAADLPSGQGNIHLGAMHRYLCDAITPDVDLVLIGGNGFRAVGAIRAAEADTGVPIVSANTALLWWTLQTMGRPTDQVSSYGRLFTS